MKDDLERPPRGYNTTDVEAQRTADRGGSRLLRGLVILLVLALALAVLLATGLLQR